MNRPRKSPKPKGEDNPEFENTSNSESTDLFSEFNPNDLGQNMEEHEVEFDKNSNIDFDSDIFDVKDDNTLLDFDLDADEFSDKQRFESKHDYENPPPFPPTEPYSEKEINDDSSDQSFKYEYDPNRSYLFIFGPKSAGKTVIISSILKYLRSYRSRTFGDTLMNINDKNIIHEREGNKLWRELTEANINNEFPSGTQNVEATRVYLNNPAPRHLNLNFSPATNHPDFSFCIMDMAGEDLSKVDYESNAPLPSSIRTYIEDVPKQNMCFIYVLDPLCESLNKPQQTALFEAFIETLDTNGHTSTPLLIIVSKWDTIMSKYTDIKDFLEMEYEDISGYSHQANRDITILEYSIGEVHDNKPIRFDHTYPERLFNWLYKNQTGNDLNSEINGPDKSIFRNFLNRFKKNK
jgi:GTPase SAR1 family protein